MVMGFFESDDDEPDDDSPEDDDPASDYETHEPEMETVTETKEKEYTYHEAVVHYPNGDTDEVSFDFMKRKDDEVLIGDYTTFNPNRSRMTSSGFGHEVTDSFPIANHRRFETVNREKRTMEYEVERKVPVGVVGHP